MTHQDNTTSLVSYENSLALKNPHIWINTINSASTGAAVIFFGEMTHLGYFHFILKQDLGR